MTYSLHQEIDPDHPHQIAWKHQRETRGFDDTELWNLDSTIAKFILPRLKRFKELTNQHPHDFRTMEQWDDALDKMIDAFEFMVEEKYECFSGPRWDEVNKGIELFAKYFSHLWI